MNEFFTWTNLATIAGATAATAYIVQFLKKFNFFAKLNSQAVSYGVSLVLLFLATYFTGGLTVATGVMIPLNAIIVAFSSNGAYDAISGTISEVISDVGKLTGGNKEIATTDPTSNEIGNSDTKSEANAESTDANTANQ